MRKRQRSATPGGVEIHFRRAEGFHPHTDLDVPQLTHKIMMSLTAAGPSQKHVAGGLHGSIAVHDTLAVVGKSAGAGIRFEYRGPRFLDLQEQRIASAR